MFYFCHNFDHFYCLMAQRYSFIPKHQSVYNYLCISKIRSNTAIYGVIRNNQFWLVYLDTEKYGFYSTRFSNMTKEEFLSEKATIRIESEKTETLMAEIEKQIESSNLHIFVSLIKLRRTLVHLHLD